MSTMLKSTPLPLTAPSKEETMLFYAKCGSYVKRKSSNQEVIEDFPAWALEKFLTKGITRVDLLLIDYLRSNFGYVGSSKNEAMHSMSVMEDWMEFRLEETSAEGKLLFTELLAMLEDREKTLVTLYFVDGLTLKEVATELSLTEARVSQMLKAVLEMLKEKLK